MFVGTEPAAGPQPRVLDWSAVTVAAGAGAALASAMGLPGGLVFGSTIGAGAVVLGRHRAWQVPARVRDVVMVAVGVTVGIRVTPDTIGVLGTTLGGAVLASLLLVAAGWAIAAVLTRLGVDVPGGLMATSPGALEVLTVIALEDGEGPLEVALFHTVRVVLVMVSIPLLLLLLP